jgi:uncharacterized cupredoxin-like copper-binding protein
VRAARGEALNKVDGVQEASVNLATEKAHVVFDAQTASLEQLRAAVERAGAAMHAEPGLVEVPAGTTARLIYTFDQPGTLEYACHVAGHYAAGMRGPSPFQEPDVLWPRPS